MSELKFTFPPMDEGQDLWRMVSVPGPIIPSRPQTRYDKVMYRILQWLSVRFEALSLRCEYRSRRYSARWPPVEHVQTGTYSFSVKRIKSEPDQPIQSPCLPPKNDS